MHKKLLTLAVVGLALGCAETATQPLIDGPQLGVANGGGKAVVHTARGSGNIGLEKPGRVLTFTAKEHADGSVSGNVLLQFPSNASTFRGEVTCLRVVGNQAFIGGVNLPNSDSQGEIGFVVEDNGEGRNDDPDRATLMVINGLPGLAQLVCDGGFPFFGPFDVFRGNIQVN